MPRHRNLSTTISIDSQVEALVAAAGPVAALLYTWAIPHADDWGRLSGDPAEFRLQVCPGLGLSITEVDTLLDEIADARLWQRYTAAGKRCLAFPPEAWYRHQSYIPRAKREKDGSALPPPPAPQNAAERRAMPQDAAERRESAQIPTSPSPSPSPIETRSREGGAGGTSGEPAGAPAAPPDSPSPAGAGSPPPRPGALALETEPGDAPDERPQDPPRPQSALERLQGLPGYLAQPDDRAWLAELVGDYPGIRLATEISACSAWWGPKDARAVPKDRRWRSRLANWMRKAASPPPARASPPAGGPYVPGIAETQANLARERARQEGP